MAEEDKTQALSLLQGILDETASEAEAAREQLEQELKRKEEDAKAQAAAEEQARRDEIARRIEAEEERQRTAAERRHHALEELRIEDLKAKGLWKEPTPISTAAVEAKPAAQVPSTGAMLAVQKKNNRGMVYAAAAIVFALVAGAGGAWFYMNQQFVDATTPFPASSPSVVALADASAVVAFQAIPEPEAPAAAVADGRTSGRNGSSRGGSDSGRSGSSSSSSDTSSGPTLNLGGNLGGN